MFYGEKEFWPRMELRISFKYAIWWDVDLFQGVKQLAWCMAEGNVGPYNPRAQVSKLGGGRGSQLGGTHSWNNMHFIPIFFKYWPRKANNWLFIKSWDVI